MVRDTTVLLDERRIFEPSEEIKKEPMLKIGKQKSKRAKCGKYWAEKAEQFEWFKNGTK